MRHARRRTAGTSLAAAPRRASHSRAGGCRNSHRGTIPPRLDLPCCDSFCGAAWRLLLALRDLATLSLFGHPADGVSGGLGLLVIVPVLPPSCGLANLSDFFLAAFFVGFRCPLGHRTKFLPDESETLLRGHLRILLGQLAVDHPGKGFHPRAREFGLELFLEPRHIALEGVLDLSFRDPLIHDLGDNLTDVRSLG